MKLMNISLSIDVCNAEHLTALTAFAAALGGHNLTLEQIPAPTAQATELKTEEKPKKTPLKKVAPVVEAVEETPEVETEETPEVETEEETVEEVETENGVDRETLRGSVGALVKLDRSNADKIKAKLAEFGVASVSTLDPKDFGAFYTYIKSLS